MPVNYHKPTSVAYVNGSKIELFSKFYYLGDTLNAKRNNDFQKENSKILWQIYRYNCNMQKIMHGTV